MVSTCSSMSIHSSSFLFSVPGGWPKWTTAIGSLAWLGWARRSHEQRMSLVYSLLWIPLCENLELTDCDLSESLCSFLHGFLCMVFAVRVPVSSSSFLSSSLGIVMVTWQPCSSLYLTCIFANSTIVLGWPKSLFGFFHKMLQKTWPNFWARPMIWPSLHCPISSVSSVSRLILTIPHSNNESDLLRAWWSRQNQAISRIVDSRCLVCCPDLLAQDLCTHSSSCQGCWWMSSLLVTILCWRELPPSILYSVPGVSLDPVIGLIQCRVKRHNSYPIWNAFLWPFQLQSSL